MALFWPVLPAALWLVGLLALGATFWALYGAAVWLLLTLPLTAHPRLLRRLRLQGGVLEHRLEWGVTHRVRVDGLSQAVICQLARASLAYPFYPAPVSALRFGRDPHLYLLDGAGRLRLRIRLTYLEESKLERLLEALQLPVSRLGTLSSYQFQERYPGVLLRYRALGQNPKGLLLFGCGVMAALSLLAVLGALVGLAWTAPRS